MSADTREAQSIIANDDATDAGEQVKIYAGRDISASLLDRIGVIELYIYEFIEVVGKYESQVPNRQAKLAA